MKATIKPRSQDHQKKLRALTSLYDQFKEVYGPVLGRMTQQQLTQLHKRDPLFAKFVEIGRDLSRLAERVGVDL